MGWSQYTAREFAYGQGLAYCWGRIDGAEPTLPGREISFANYWAEVSQHPSRPSIQDAFNNWKADKS